MADVVSRSQSSKESVTPSLSRGLYARAHLALQRHVVSCSRHLWLVRANSRERQSNVERRRCGNNEASAESSHVMHSQLVAMTHSSSSSRYQSKTASKQPQSTNNQQTKEGLRAVSRDVSPGGQYQSSLTRFVNASIQIRDRFRFSRFRNS